MRYGSDDEEALTPSPLTRDRERGREATASPSPPTLSSVGGEGFTS